MNIAKKAIYSALGCLLLLLVASSAHATSVCPNIGQANGCNLLITINSNSTITLTTPVSKPYDGVEDQLVGITNNSSATITQLFISGTGIGGFDFDGAWAGGNACIASGSNTYGCGTPTQTGNTQQYAGPLTTFSNVTLNSLTVNFDKPLKQGQSAYFSLEEKASVQGTAVQTTPEPASLLLLGTGLLGVGILVRRHA